MKRKTRWQGNGLGFQPSPGVTLKSKGCGGEREQEQDLGKV